MAFQIHFYSYIFISGYGQLQNEIEILLATTLMITFFTIISVFFLAIFNEKYHKLMYLTATIGGIIIAILITLNFIAPLFFNLPIIK